MSVITLKLLMFFIKTANVFYHPVKAKNLNFKTYIYILYFQSMFSFLFPHTIANFPDI